MLRSLIAALMLLAVAVNARSLGAGATRAGDHHLEAGAANLLAPATRRLLQNDDSCRWGCGSGCVECAGYRDLGNGLWHVTVNVTKCKYSAISWMCCRGSSTQGNTPGTGSCNLVADSCPTTNDYGSKSPQGKCNEALTSVFEVPAGTDLLTVQIHDGQLTGTNPCTNTMDCCGGKASSCGEVSGVCNEVVSLVGCPLRNDNPTNPGGDPTPPNTCSNDTDCYYMYTQNITASQVCAEPKCVNQQCQVMPIPASRNFVCRTANGTCDTAETCDGTQLTCPADGFADDSTVCRPANGVCDVEEHCTGLSNECPADGYASSDVVCRPADGICDVAETCTGTGPSCPNDTFAADTTVCRPQDGPCDVAETCTGSSAACPSDGYASASTMCRPAAGVCDVDDYCTGNGPACPTDVFQPTGTTCRAAAGICDAPEVCTGSSATCPEDVKLPSSEVCRPAVNKCDKPEFCTGSSDDCPRDVVLRGSAKAFKCGRVCYFCGLPAFAATKVSSELSVMKNTYSIGAAPLSSCNLGSCDNLVYLNPEHPSCGNNCVSTICDNGRALSNIQHAICDAATGAWNCIYKQEGTFTEAVCPPLGWAA